MCVLCVCCVRVRRCSCLCEPCQLVLSVFLHQKTHNNNNTKNLGVLTAPERATLAIVVRLRALSKLSMEKLASIARRGSEGLSA